MHYAVGHLIPESVVLSLCGKVSANGILLQDQNQDLDAAVLAKHWAGLVKTQSTVSALPHLTPPPSRHLPPPPHLENKEEGDKTGSVRAWAGLRGRIRVKSSPSRAGGERDWK